ncbi:uncharacterized protein LOC135827325 isoform X2 [Sycon ciliatum]|uniref:uncharacterized protein LOC135827325 isoform X2 n=1 Tax=Sycon ciliatum TaxID=27933 RepID=UPI0031F6BB58
MRPLLLEASAVPTLLILALLSTLCEASDTGGCVPCTCVSNETHKTVTACMDIATIDLRGKGVTDIMSIAFSMSPTTTAILLTGIPIKSLPDGIFDGVQALQKLHIAHIMLTHLSADIFRNNTGLREIDVSNNQLASLPAGIFGDLTFLEKVVLTGNKIQSLPDGIFDGVRVLQILYISNNKLTKLSADIFRNNTAWKEINLSGNQINSLPDGIFDGIRGLQKLYIAANMLTHLPAGIFRSNTDLKEINLSGNQIKSLPDGIFDGVPGLQKLYITHNKLTHLSADIFRSNTDLKEIILPGNQIESLPDGIFDGVRGLQKLHIYDNKLTNLSAGIFRSNTDLKEISIHGNSRLIVLPPDIFQNNTNLELLDWSNNIMKTLPMGFFSTWSFQLSVLLIKNTNLATLNADVFQDCTNLKTLGLDGNKLTHLPPRLFQHHKKLMIVGLSGNPLDTLPEALFGTEINSLTQLYIQGDTFTKDHRLCRARLPLNYANKTIGNDPMKNYVNALTDKFCLSSCNTIPEMETTCPKHYTCVGLVFNYTCEPLPRVYVSAANETTVHRADTPLTLIFWATHDPRPKVKLEFEGATIWEQTNETIPDGVIDNVTITEYPITTRNASGVYTLTASSAIGTVVLKHRLIIVSAPIISSPSDGSKIHVREFSAPMITCNSSGNPHPGMVWLGPSMFEYIRSLSGNVVKNALVFHSISYTFPSITRLDAGKYVCEAPNSQGNSSVTLDIVVEYMQDECKWPNSRTLVYRPDQNRSISVTCQCSAVPLATYTRTIDRMYGALKGSTTTNITAINSTFILDILPTSAGTYGCSASNNPLAAPTDVFNSTFTIDIKAPPHMTFSDNTVRLGNDITVDCTVRSFPRSSGLAWTYANTTSVVNNGQFNVTILGMPMLNSTTGLYEQTISLSITNVQFSHRANYLCVAENGVSPTDPALDFRGNSDVTATATFSLDTQGISHASFFPDVPSQNVYHVREAMIVKCSATGFPQLQIKWFSTAASFSNATQTHNGMSTTTYSFNATSGEAVGVLQIDSIQYSDAGLYWCQLDNGLFDKSSNSVNITVLGSPNNTFISPLLTLKEFSKGIVSCEFTARPAPSLTWYDRSGVKISNSPNATVTVNRTVLNPEGDFTVRSVLSLTNVRRDDNTQYLCVASNGLANTTRQLNSDRSSGVNSSYSATATATLDILFGPVITKGLYEWYNVDLGGNITLSCTATGNPLPAVYWTRSAFYNLTSHFRVRNGKSRESLAHISVPGQELNGSIGCTVQSNLNQGVTLTTTIYSKDIDECASNPCVNGNCTSGIQWFTCSCDVGWTGNLCDTKPKDYDECLSNPCLNNATCQDHPFAFTCICPQGYMGSRCQSLIACPALHKRDSSGMLCIPCSCNAFGTSACDPDKGNCLCKANVTGDNCDTCEDGLYAAGVNVDSCLQCTCAANTTQPDKTCNGTTGACNCLTSYGGRSCQHCSPGNYRKDGHCVPCVCSASGAYDTSCDVLSGQCNCRPGNTGQQCMQCDDGHYRLSPTLLPPKCVPYKTNQECQLCNCSPLGSISASCSADSGECQCRPNYEGHKCDTCISRSHFYTTKNGCQELASQLFKVSAETLVNATRLNLNHPFVFGSKFKSVKDVTVSVNGFMSLNRFSGGYNLNARVTEHAAIIAPYWTEQRHSNDSCPSGTVQVHYVNSTDVNGNLSAIIAAVEAQFKPQAVFRPREAVIATWRDIRDQNNKRNTFQAALISDECQSYAVMTYPDGGITWAGFPYPVVAAGQPLPTSGTDHVTPISGVYNLTNGCNAKLRAEKECRAQVTSAILIPFSNLVKGDCPSSVEVARSFTAFKERNETSSHDCFVSGFITRGGNQLASQCCYSKAGGQLVVYGPYQPYQLISRDDDILRARCNTAGLLPYFMARRNIPQHHVTLKQGFCYGDPHFVSMAGNKFDFHVVGEYTLAHATGKGYSMTIVARMEIVPMNNSANFTSITRIAITVAQDNKTDTLEVYSKQGQIEVEGRLTSQDIERGNDNFHLQPSTNSIIARIGSVGANISVQSHPILAVAFQMQNNTNFTGLLDIDHNDDMGGGSTTLQEQAKQYQVTSTQSPFAYFTPNSYEHFNPTKPPNTGTVDTSSVNVTECSRDTDCIADYLVTGNLALAQSTREFNQEFSLARNISSRTPPSIKVTPAVLHGTYQQTSTVTITVSTVAPLTITNLQAYSVGGISVTIGHASATEYSVIWTPSKRLLMAGAMVYVTAQDSGNARATQTIPVTLCGCFGTCQQPPAATELTDVFTQLDCASCDAGRTGENCAEDLDSCIGEPCANPLYKCTDIALPSTGFKCSCRPGFTEVYGQCNETDECMLGTHNCATDGGRSTCKNTNGSYLCECSPGYNGPPTCAGDYDECSMDADDCDDGNSTCTNILGSYKCSCRTGYEGSGRLRTGGCAIITCKAPVIAHGKRQHHSVVQYDEDVVYSCNTGYWINGSATSTCSANGKLTAIPECVIVNCTLPMIANGTWEKPLVYYLQSVTFQCDNGFGRIGDKNHTCSQHGNVRAEPSCRDIDECSSGAHQCDVNSLCGNTVGSFLCSCITGYFGNGTVCSPVNCTLPMIANGTWEKPLVYYLQSVTFQCDNGFGQIGDKNHTCSQHGNVTAEPSCQELDECASGSHECDVHSLCGNTVGSYLCSCTTGYTGNGTVCSLKGKFCSPFSLPNLATSLSYNGTERLGDNISIACAAGFDVVQGANKTNIYICSNVNGTGMWQGDAKCSQLEGEGGTSQSTVALIAISGLLCAGAAATLVLFIYRRGLQASHVISRECPPLPGPVKGGQDYDPIRKTPAHPILSVEGDTDYEHDHIKMREMSSTRTAKRNTITSLVTEHEADNYSLYADTASQKQGLTTSPCSSRLSVTSNTAGAMGHCSETEPSLYDSVKGVNTRLSETSVGEAIYDETGLGNTPSRVNAIYDETGLGNSPSKVDAIYDETGLGNTPSRVDAIYDETGLGNTPSKGDAIYDETGLGNTPSKVDAIYDETGLGNTPSRIDAIYDETGLGDTASRVDAVHDKTGLVDATSVYSAVYAETNKASGLGNTASRGDAVDDKTDLGDTTSVCSAVYAETNKASGLGNTASRDDAVDDKTDLGDTTSVCSAVYAETNKASGLGNTASRGDAVDDKTDLGDTTSVCSAVYAETNKASGLGNTASRVHAVDDKTDLGDTTSVYNAVYAETNKGADTVGGVDVNKEAGTYTNGDEATHTETDPGNDTMTSVYANNGKGHTRSGDDNVYDVACAPHQTSRGDAAQAEPHPGNDVMPGDTGYEESVPGNDTIPYYVGHDAAGTADDTYEETPVPYVIYDDNATAAKCTDEGEDIYAVLS